MGKFASAKTQAKSVVKELKSSGTIRSLGTARNYTQALTPVAEYAKVHSLSLRDLTRDHCDLYLAERGEDVGQKTLDMERQAIQQLLYLTGESNNKQRLYAVSEFEQILHGRAYTPVQVEMIWSRQHVHNSLATELAYKAGLRAHELLTIRPKTEQPADPRPTLKSKFAGRTGVLYTVRGKGGLVRDVLLPNDLAERLERRRLASPRKVYDREIYYTQFYNISGGNTFSSSFNQASNRALEWSTGAHGLRHSYAQERMNELQKLGFSRAISLETVSQEMGHFRPFITETYLR